MTGLCTFWTPGSANMRPSLGPMWLRSFRVSTTQSPSRVEICMRHVKPCGTIADQGLFRVGKRGRSWYEQGCVCLRRGGGGGGGAAVLLLLLLLRLPRLPLSP